MGLTDAKVETRFVQSRDRGCQYLLKQQRADGGFGPVERGITDYYKVIAAYLVSGASADANRLCDWIRKHGITQEGDFGPRPDEASSYCYIYYNAWVIQGAHRQGHFDLSRRGMNFVSDLWDSVSGGFYSSPTDRTAQTPQDLWVTAGGGQAALYTGRIDIARGVGSWMKRLMELQPDYPRYLYPVYSRAIGLHTTSAPEEKARFVFDPQATYDQYFFNPGIAAGFLASLYKATGEIGWLNLARRYMLQAEGGGDYFFRSLRAGKVGWAASVLYTLTGESKYRDMAVRVGDNLVATQNEDGSWNSIAGSKYINDVTAEMVIWLDEIHQAVGGRIGA